MVGPTSFSLPGGCSAGGFRCVAVNIHPILLFSNGPRLKRILLVNDTGQTSNPGCQAASRGVRRAYAQLTGSCEFRSLPLGYGVDPFRALAAAPRDCVVREADRFAHGRDVTPSVDVDRFGESVLTLEKSDPELAALAEWADLVVVNGEGSLHHQFPRALALMALLRVFSKRVAVHLVNSTLQGVQASLWQFVSQELAGVHVRDSRSAAFVREQGQEPLLTPDLALFELEVPPVISATSSIARRVLLTSGVLVTREGLHAQLEVLRHQEFEPVYLCIGDGGEEKIVREVCGEETPVVAAGPLGPSGVMRLASEFPLAVSGRHHINLFLATAGVPFVPLPSNTWKIEATLKDLGYPRQPSANAKELGQAVGETWTQRESWAEAARAMGERGLARVREFLPGVRTWRS